MTIIAIATILITGGFVISPYAYSTGYNDDSNDDSHDDSKGKCNDDSNGDCIPDPCDCEKPDKLTVRYQGPGTEDNPAIVEIYKKTEKIGDKDPLMSGIEVFVNNDPNDGSDLIVVSASDFGKKKLGSNTGYRILWDIPGDVDTEGNEIGLVEISRIDIHTSCSKLLYIGQTFTDGGDVTLIVEDGTRNGETSIPSSDPLTCEADEQPIPMTSITVKKALTNDNNVQAGPEDFTVTLTEIGDDGLVGTADDVPVETQTFDADESSFSVMIPSGTYFMTESVSEEFVDKYTTVMIAGDTACPSMESEPFKLKKDTSITCTIYNDDNFVEDDGSGGTGGTGGGDGFFFARNSLQMKVDGFGNFDENNSPSGCVNVPFSQSRPCITEDALTELLLVVDSAFEQEGGHLAAVVATVQPAGPLTVVDCGAPSGIGEHTFLGADPGPDEMLGTADDLNLVVRGFVLPCNLGAGDAGIFFVNYAVIKTAIASPWETDGIDNNGVDGVDEPGEGDGIDNDMDGMTDEDPYDNIDNDNDGLLDEDP